MAAEQCARGSNGFDGVYCTLLDLRIYSMTLVEKSSIVKVALYF